MENLRLNAEFKAMASHTTEFLPFYIRHLTEEMVERAEKELGETSETREQALIEMKRIVKEMNLNCPLDDCYLLPFLRARKFNVERSIDTLIKYFNFKKNNTAIFGKKNFESLMKVCDDEICVVPLYRDVDGAVIVIIQVRHWNVAESSFPTLIHAVTSIFLGSVDLQPATQICGIKLIFDVKGLGINHIVHMSPRNVLRAAQGIQSCLPMRFRAFHVFNESTFVSYLWKILKMTLSDKLRNRVHFHSSSFESLHSKIKPELLPESLGGTLVYDKSVLMKVVKDNKSRYFEMMSYGFN